MIPITRELIESTLIESIECGAVQQCQHRRDVLIDEGQHRPEIRYDTRQSGRNPLLGCLEEEATEIVPLEQGLRVVDPARQIAGIYPDERVYCASVSAELNDLGIFGGKDSNIGLKLCELEVLEGGTHTYYCCYSTVRIR